MIPLKDQHLPVVAYLLKTKVRKSREQDLKPGSMEIELDRSVQRSDMVINTRARNQILKEN